jgi:hypothetical protein
VKNSVLLSKMNLFKQIKLAKHFRNIELVLISTRRMSSAYLINQPQYSFLRELGLDEVNHGVFAGHGRWFGDGQVKIFTLKKIFFLLI